MRKLVIARNGEFREDGSLTPTGLTQIELLITSLCGYLVGHDRVFVLHSPWRPCVATAALIRSALDGTASSQTELNSVFGMDMNDRRALLSITRIPEAIDMLVVVTDVDYCRTLPTLAAYHYTLGPLEPRLVRYGEAWVLDIEKRVTNPFSYIAFPDPTPQKKKEKKGAKVGS